MASTVAIPQYITYPGNDAKHLQTGTTSYAIPGDYISSSISSKSPMTSGNFFSLQQIHPGGCGYSDGMEVVWHGEFCRLFGTFYPPHIWYLTTTNQRPNQNWKQHCDSAKVRFCCQDCGNGWTSMKGRVTFWFHLDHHSNTGFLQFKLYGQQCKKCNSGKFEYVMWYPEEVSKVMCNVYHKVGQTYYGFQQPHIRVDRRPGRPRHQHNSDLCQACRDGECDQARSETGALHLNGLVHASLSTTSRQNTSTRSTDSSNAGEKLTPKYMICDFPPSRDVSTDVDSTPQTSPALSRDSEKDEKRKERSKTVQKVRYRKTSGQQSATDVLSHPSGIFTAPLQTINSQFFYHPAPINPFLTGATPLYPPTVYPLYAHYPTFSPTPRTLASSVDVAEITERISSVNLSDDQIDTNQKESASRSFIATTKKEI